MKLKHYMILTLASTVVILLSACGGGGGDSATFENSEIIIDINTSCVADADATDIAGYISLQSGDVIIQDSNNANISIYHDANGTKKVCLNVPSAHIVRQP